MWCTFWSSPPHGSSISLSCPRSTALSAVTGFSVDTNQPIVFQSSDQGFGYQVAQMDKRVIVSAPLHQPSTNKSGQLYQCDPGSGKCQPISISGRISHNVSLHNQNGHTACGPTLQRVCGKNIYVNGRCYRLDNRLRLQESLPAKLPDCNVFNLDVALLIDGSGSINSRDFRLMLDFVSKVMEAFKDTETRFALMQYSSTFETHFDFNQFAAARNPSDLVQGITQLRSVTKTSSAIIRVDELFTPQAGSRDGAQRVLIVITDGETYGETPRYDVAIGRANIMGVLRFVIGVSEYSESQHNPTDHHNATGILCW
uniref:VWFA domain-containing protein n=1 Tax=Leptobrachium leishanense TaxID=445787 RepID=A0A8C5WFI9_9ANUR